VEEGSIRRYLGSSAGSSSEPRHSSPLRNIISPTNTASIIRQGSLGGSPVLRQSPRVLSGGEKSKEVANARGGEKSLEEGEEPRPRERKRKLFSKVHFHSFFPNHHWFYHRQHPTFVLTLHILLEELSLLQCSARDWMKLWGLVVKRSSPLLMRESK